MPTIRLASWHDGRAPGATVDVTDEEMAQLQRDGRVAEVLPDKPEPEAEQPAGQAEEAAEPATAEAEAEAPAKSSRRRR
ncbi:hypothetical protein EF913_28220 [Streptomyces sp. WAC04189]|uniref:hypothetical protein n=1 Tax=Streptomyces TaxID=1883 RepID=UPI000FA6C456|nr:hypothetical protein [Streptomyces sp. WAC04189]RSR98018.1 hypothetical protein EF913_28220 [Streptomyces sp. WAC04189]